MNDHQNRTISNISFSKIAVFCFRDHQKSGLLLEMADKFISDDFMLQSLAARELYHEFAKDEPILDFHNHLPPDEIAANRSYQDMSDIWLGGDHYKWRAMRVNGICENHITGDASPREKFDAWAQTVPHTLRNALYHWTHLELDRYFGYEKLFSPDTADEVWEMGNTALANPEFSCRSLLERMKVTGLCTTDDPVDSLEPVSYTHLTLPTTPYV